MLLDAGTVVDRYAVEGLLGRGGMASVYRVRHLQLDSHHALKVLSVPADAVRDRLLLEGRVQASLRHPNIVAVTDIVVVKGAPGLILELVDGPSLESLLATHRPDLPTARALGKAIVAGVAHAHRAGLVHRDLKPANVLLQAAEGLLVPKVSDFGLAKLFDGDGDGSGRTRSGLPMGTPAYMAPEQIRDAKTIDRRADVWALGAILYELACGRRAFDQPDVLALFGAIGAGHFTPPRELAPDLPEEMERAILGALVVDREARLPDCDALLTLWGGAGGAATTSLGAPLPEAWAAELRRAPATFSRSPSAPALPSAGRGTGETWSLDDNVLPRAGATQVPSLYFEGNASEGVPAPATLEGADALGGPAEGLASARRARRRRLRLVAGVGLLVAGIGLGVWGTSRTGLGHPPAGTEAVTTGPDGPRSASPLSPTEASAQVPPSDPSAVASVPASPAPASRAPASRAPASPAPASPAPASPAPALPSSASATIPAPSTPSTPSVARVASASGPDGATARTEPAPEAPPSLPEIVEVTGPSPGMALVTVTGDARRVWLVSADGQVPAGEVPPGSYEVTAFFDGVTPTPTGRIALDAGETRVLRCSAALMVCR